MPELLNNQLLETGIVSLQQHSFDKSFQMPDLLNHYSTQDLGIEAYYLCLTTSPTNRFSTPSTNCQIMTVIWHLISWPSIKSLICRVKVPMAGSGCSPTPLAATDISAMDDSSFKVGRLSVEERKEKIDRYMKKRAERNFSKKIKVKIDGIKTNLTGHEM